MTGYDSLFRRAADLYNKSQNSGVVTSTNFLTPAEQAVLEKEASFRGYDNMFLHGGMKNAERKMAFFLPYYITVQELDISEYMCAFEVTARFSNLSHRDYLGAILGLGVKREFIGDIVISGEKAYFLCVMSVAQHIALNLDKVGRYGARTEKIVFSMLPEPVRNVREINFTVKSMRIDAVAAGMFGTSRTTMADEINNGLVSLNYETCVKTDSDVCAGDIISIRGRGKGIVVSDGGMSRKGRIFVKAEIYM